MNTTTPFDFSRLRRIRLAANLSQGEFCKRIRRKDKLLGTNWVSLSIYEHGKREPQGHVRKAIEAVLDDLERVRL